ncbi:MAG: protein phosphatase 2C domain-containing protein [Propionibacteriaceae bacterium]|jgi:protein phosphatase|nr:protein phosphatase 2C domain-containing protein [Propionibacteriaceae bacterium]
MTLQLGLEVGAKTTAGPKRPTNEDSVVATPPVFLVADGMGGHDAGERASAIVAQEMARLHGKPDIREVHDALHRACLAINSLEGRAAHQAGTTVAGMVMTEQGGAPYWLVINLGDSRTYRASGGVVEQISVDHSEVQELVAAGRITESEARTHPKRNVVTRVLGAGTVEQPDYWLLSAGDAERWMICSDGLTSEVSQTQIEAALLAPMPPQEVVDGLVSSALAAGGHDNVSVIVVDVHYLQEAGYDVTVNWPDHTKVGFALDGPTSSWDPSWKEQYYEV